MFNFSFLYSLAHKESSHHWKVKLARSIDIFINHRPYRDNNLNKHSVHRGKKTKRKFFWNAFDSLLLKVVTFCIKFIMIFFLLFHRNCSICVVKARDVSFCSYTLKNVQFCYHWDDYQLNWTLLGPIAHRMVDVSNVRAKHCWIDIRTNSTRCH